MVEVQSQPREMEEKETNKQEDIPNDDEKTEDLKFDKGGQEPDNNLDENCKRKNAIIDSDSDSDINTFNTMQDNSVDTTRINKSMSRKRIGIVDSDSDIDEENKNKMEINENVDDESNSATTTSTNRKRITVAESDSDEELTPVTPHNKSFNDERLPGVKPDAIYNVNSKGELIPETSDYSVAHKSRLAALCDSESSDEERHIEDERPPENETDDSRKVEKPVRYRKKKTKDTEEPKPKKMSGKEAAEHRKEIQAESQRMIRESNISLPYHKPKTYSIKEFLAKRSKLAPIPVPSKVPAPIAIKMPKTQLEIISKKLDERIKEVEEFYKSESESDDEEKERNEIKTDVTNWLDEIVHNAISQVEIRNDMEDLMEGLIEKVITVVDGADFSMEIDRIPQMEESEPTDFEFNLDDIDEEKEKTPPKKTALELLKEKLGNVKPRLSGGPDEVIDLDTGISRPNDVKQLVEKYIQNTAIAPKHKNKVETSVICFSDGDVHKETIAMNVDDDDQIAGPHMEIPGAKLRKLKEQLEIQMAQERSVIWQQKKNETICPNKDENDAEKEGYEDDILDDEDEEAELTESSEEEEEEIEDDVEIKEKKREKSDFVDDEAEESDVEEETEETDANDPEDDNNDNGEDGDTESSDNEEETEKPKVRSLKRIVKGFNEDSDEENDVDSENKMSFTKEPESENNENHPLNVSADEEFLIPPNLPKVQKTPQPDRHKPDLDFLTPVTYLTGLQNLNTDPKESPPAPSPLRFSSQPSPLKDDKWQKKLFQDSSDVPQTQLEESMNELADMCSGKFPETQQTSKEHSPSTQDLLDVCSGEFPSTVPKSVNITINENNEIKELGEDQILSQILDDDLKEFEKKLHSNAPDLDTTVEEIKATGVIDSDDENGELEIHHKKKAKNVVFSDDDSSDEEEDDDVEDEIQLHDEDEEEESDKPDNVEYDSEENEIEDPKKFKLTDFLDKEAELSESEWGSADEDEQGMDYMEMEQGDQEEIDENKLRSDIERIHMRKMLDEDVKEVRLLQELLLEDGEMHGTGRQRQFRWRNIDNNDTGDDNVKRDDDDIYLDEEESEEQFRKMRHKREMFLKEKTASEDVDSILQESAVLRIGQKAIRRSQTINVSSSTTVVEKTEEIVIKQPFTLLNKRGSFLSRSDQVLQRLAEYTKVSTGVVNSSAPKNRRSFVFQTVNVEESELKENKRKAAEDTPKAIKKMRLGNNFISPAAKKTIEVKPGGSKKLF